MTALMRTLVLGFLVFSAPAWADRVDFTGAWKLDEGASDTMEAVLALEDVGWAKRKLVESLDAEVVIQQDAGKLIATFDNLLGDAKQQLFFDGKPHETVNPAGFAATFTTQWLDDRTMVATGPSSGESGSPGTLTETRSLSADGKTMQLVVKVTAADGRSATSKRVFKRQ
jgi:hypothetical protein